MARDADLVAVGEDLGTHGDGGVVAVDDFAREIDPWDERADPGDAAVGARGQTVLVVDAGPADADLDLALGEVRFGEFADAAIDRWRAVALDLFSDERAERGGDGGHWRKGTRSWGGSAAGRGPSSTSMLRLGFGD